MTKSEVLQRTEASVVSVESKLNELDKLHLQAAKLADLIQNAQDAEADILSSNAPEKDKVSALLRVRAQRDARQAGLNATKAEISAVEQEIITLGNRAELWAGALRDSVTAAAKSRVGGIVKAYFKQAAHIEIDRLLSVSLAVRAIDELDRPFFMSANIPLSIANARKLRPTFNALEELANNEPELSEVIVGADW
jgi:hypothetical protein